MTQDWIDQFNKKCAEFLDEEEMRIILEMNAFSYPSVENMKFHSDWNWIHEVIDKIISINNYSPKGQRYRFNSNRSSKHNRNEFDKPFKIRVTGILLENLKSFSVDSFNEKEATIQVIDQFIDWYNEQKITNRN